MKKNRGLISIAIANSIETVLVILILILSLGFTDIPTYVYTGLFVLMILVILGWLSLVKLYPHNEQWNFYFLFMGILNGFGIIATIVFAIVSENDQTLQEHIQDPFIAIFLVPGVLYVLGFYWNIKKRKSEETD